MGKARPTKKANPPMILCTTMLPSISFWIGPKKVSKKRNLGPTSTCHPSRLPHIKLKMLVDLMRTLKSLRKRPKPLIRHIGKNYYVTTTSNIKKPFSRLWEKVNVFVEQSTMVMVNVLEAIMMTDLGNTVICQINTIPTFQCHLMITSMIVINAEAEEVAMPKRKIGPCLLSWPVLVATSKSLDSMPGKENLSSMPSCGMECLPKMPSILNGW